MESLLVFKPNKYSPTPKLGTIRKLDNNSSQH